MLTYSKAYKHDLLTHYVYDYYVRRSGLQARIFSDLQELGPVLRYNRTRHHMRMLNVFLILF